MAYSFLNLTSQRFRFESQFKYTAVKLGASGVALIRSTLLAVPEKE
jgi:hypothetical protein